MKIKILTLCAFAIIMASCGEKQAVENNATAQTKEVKAVSTNTTAVTNPMLDKGVGPITSVTLGDIDDALVSKGKELFKAKCTACHKIGKRFVGPALKGVTKKQSAEWIMNMMLNPEGMVTKDEVAKKLLAEYNAPMANQSLTEDEARSILEFLRTKN